jgi:dihydrofolate reductase
MKVILYPAISLDGFIAHLNGDSDWVTAEDEALFAKEVQNAGCVIVGNRTFKQYKDSIYPIANAITFVCTSQPLPSTENIKYVTGTVTEILAQVQAAGFTTAILSGGADTNRRFAEAQAIDELIVSSYPQILGRGLSLFGGLEMEVRLELLDTKPLQSGIIQNRYRILD